MLIFLYERYNKKVKQTRGPVANLCSSAVLAWVVIFSGGMTSTASSESEPGLPQPDIQFEEKIYNFGRVDEGSKVTHIYKFKNVGQGDLHIEKIRSTCGCIATLLTDGENIIPPGGEAEIKVVFDTKGRKGYKSKTLFIHSNDPNESLLKFRLTGLVGPPLALKPDKLLFLDVDRRQLPITRKLIASPVGKELLKIAKIESTSAYLTAKIVKNTPEHRNRVEIAVTLSPKVPSGSLNEKLRLYAEDEEEPVIEVPVIVIVKREIKVIPLRLLFGYIPKGQTPSRQMIVKQVYNPDNKDLKILKVECSGKYLSARVSSEKGKQYKITVTLIPGASPGRIEDTIKIHTNNPWEPVVKVPVSGLVGN